MRSIRLGPMALVLLLVLIAWTRPQWGWSRKPVHRAAGTVWLCLDVSRSMLVRDAPGNRLEHAQRLAQELVTGSLAGRRVGLIAVAGDARVVCPPTDDLDHVRHAIETLSIDSAPPGGSDLTSVLRLLAKRNRASTSPPATVVVFSDGGHRKETRPPVDPETGSPSPVVFPVFTIGIGDPQRASPIPLPGDAGPLVENRRVVRSRLDEAPLEELASETGGRYVRAAAGAVDLPVVFTRQLAPRADIAEKRSVRRTPIERYRLFLLPAVLLAAFAPMLRKRGNQRDSLTRGSVECLARASGW